MTPLDSNLIARLPRTTLVVGKGGVGKTTTACDIARTLARRGDETLLISTDPAAALSTVLGQPVATHTMPVAGEPHLYARQLDAAELRTAFLEEWRPTIATIIDRGTYLDTADVDGLVDAALPGADEIFAVLALADLIAAPDSPYARIVVDTAPTGHTLRLLALPDTFRALVSMLDLMQDKHRFMVRALTHRYRRDPADEFLDEMRRRIDALRAALADAHQTAAVVVTRPEPVVEVETQRYVAALERLGVAIAGTVEVLGARPSALGTAFGGLPSAEGRVPSTLVKTLTIIGGKGGVGKSTVACALGIAAAEQNDGAVLLVSTDPAPSLADALGHSDAPWAMADVEHELEEAPGLVVRQMDATAAFARLHDEYQTRIDALFDGLVTRGLDVAHDRAIVRDLLALAPPGIDELFALSVLGDALAEGRFARIIVDPAPTGHLLRLLDMPALALDWTHRLMRLMLKYHDVVGLGDTAQELLDFAKRTRAIEVLLRNSASAGVIVVTLDEPVVRAETERLVAAIRARSMDVAALVWNRVTETPMPLPAEPIAQQFVAEAVDPPPVGAAALRAWSRGWRRLAES